MLLLLEDAAPRYLHEGHATAQRTLVEGLRDGISGMLGALADLRRPPAYNVIFHTGPGAGIYLEFLPYTQEVGGFEQAGLWSCQANPETCAGRLREFIASTP
jgi:hypothetical protein